MRACCTPEAPWYTPNLPARTAWAPRGPSGSRRPVQDLSVNVRAEVAELVDAYDSGSYVREDVWVQVPPSAPVDGPPGTARGPIS